MNRQFVSISSENQTASTFWVVRVIFHHNGRINSFDNIANLHVVFRRRFVAVERDSHFVMRHQYSDVLESCAQFQGPALTLCIESKRIERSLGPVPEEKLPDVESMLLPDRSRGIRP